MSNGTVGRYQILGEIGRGSMATVYRALDPNSNREVAIKILPREMMHNPEFRARFRQEITMISSLEHPSIVPVYDSGEDDGQLYFVMRYMTGGSLADLLERGRLSPTRTAEIIERIALGLDYAHQKGIIHRDIKPDNVLFDTSGKPYLSDFGVAKLAEVAISDTGSGVMGTPAYLSPEQASGENNKVDNRSDVYGLGVLVYQMLTGERPFTSDTPLGVLVKHINEPVPNIRDVNPSLPPWFETVTKTAMAKNKEDRYRSVLEFSHAVSIAAFGRERTVPSALILERQRLSASKRNKTTLILSGTIFALIVAGIYFSQSALAPQATPTKKPSVTASAIPITETFTSVPSTATETVEPTSTPDVAPVVAHPGGADQIALLSGNEIYLMNIDGSGLTQVRTENSTKTNLQWISDNRLVYLSRNCIYLLDANTKQPQQLFCFDSDQQLEGFNVSPDGQYVAISVQHTLNIFPFDVGVLKNITTRFDLLVNKDNCFYNQMSFSEAFWSKDQTQLVARVIDTALVESDQFVLVNFDIGNCNNVGLTRMDTIPGGRIDFDAESTRRIGGFDWNGMNLFLFNDIITNDGYGDLYLYDSIAREFTKINPIDGQCCYRDARLSPDGTYLLFAFQRDDRGEILLYYIPFAELQEGSNFAPINLPNSLFPTSREKPQPALRPAQ